MKAYHYTSEKNLTSIADNGLTPTLIRKAELEQYFPGGVSGVWLWTKKPKGMSHAAAVLYQVAFRGTTRIVLLEVDVDESRLLSWNGQSVRVYHNGNFENLVYNTQEEACVSAEAIPANRIKLLRTFDIVELLA